MTLLLAYFLGVLFGIGVTLWMVSTARWFPHGACRCGERR